MESHNTYSEPEFVSDAKNLFFNESVHHELMNKDEEYLLFEKLDIQIRNWIAKIIMQPSASERLEALYPAIFSKDSEQNLSFSDAPRAIELANENCASIKPASKTNYSKNDLVSRLRADYPSIKRLSEITQHINELNRTNAHTLTNIKECEKRVQATIEQIVSNNTRLVVSVAKKYNFLKLPLMDLIQEGYIGLLTAIERFDLSLDYRFSTYAWWWIKQSITHYTRRQGGVVKRPESLVDLIIKLQPHVKDVAGVLAPEKVSFIANEIESSPDKLYEAISSSRPDLSLDAPMDEDNLEWSTKYIKTHDPEVILTESQVNTILDSLPKRLQLVIILRFGLHGRKSITNREIAEILNVTSERVRQLEAKALNILKEKYAID